MTFEPSIAQPGAAADMQTKQFGCTLHVPGKDKIMARLSRSVIVGVSQRLHQASYLKGMRGLSRRDANCLRATSCTHQQRQGNSLTRPQSSRLQVVTDTCVSRASSAKWATVYRIMPGTPVACLRLLLLKESRPCR